MPTLDEVYRKYGEASEAAQLVEIELGNLLLFHGIVAENLVEEPNPTRAAELFRKANRATLGQLIQRVRDSTLVAAELEVLLARVLKERNRLAHSFYRQHNFRRNSEEGRAAMIADLEEIHAVLLAGYRAVLMLSGIDLDRLTINEFPTDHMLI